MCCICCRKFADENALWTHAAFKHPKTPAESRLDITCRTCGCSFADDSEVERHLQQNAANRRKHVVTTRAEPRSGNSPGSDHVGNTEILSATRDVSAAGDACPAKPLFACPECSRKFWDKNTLWTHLAFKHPDYVDAADTLDGTAVVPSDGGTAQPSLISPSPIVSASKCPVDDESSLQTPSSAGDSCSPSSTNTARQYSCEADLDGHSITAQSSNDKLSFSSNTNTHAPVSQSQPADKKCCNSSSNGMNSQGNSNSMSSSNSMSAMNSQCYSNSMSSSSNSMSVMNSQGNSNSMSSSNCMSAMDSQGNSNSMSSSNSMSAMNSQGNSNSMSAMDSQGNRNSMSSSNSMSAMDSQGNRNSMSSSNNMSAMNSQGNSNSMSNSMSAMDSQGNSNSMSSSNSMSAMNSLGSSQGNSNSMSSSSSSNNSLSSWESLRSEEPVQLGSQLLTTLISNDLLAEHVASLEQRVAQLQLYFSQIFADLLAAGDPLNNGAALLHISAEEMCDMEVAGEVVVVSETTTDTLVTPKIEPRMSNNGTTGGGGTAKARRRRRANNNQPRCQPSQQQEGGGGHSTSETVGGAAESSATSLDPGILRTRLRV